MGSVKKEYAKSKEYSTDIMIAIEKLLTEKKISYKINRTKTEITIDAPGETKSSIRSIITNNIVTHGSIISLLIDVVDVDKTVYIRQVSK